MAITYDVVMRIYNGTDWDTLRPQTVSDNVEDTGQTHQFVTTQQKTNLDSLFDGSNVFKGLWKEDPVATGSFQIDQGQTYAGYFGSGRLTVGGVGVYGNSSVGGLGIYAGSFDTWLQLNSGLSYILVKDNITIRYGASTGVLNAKDLTTKEYVDTVAVNIKPATAVAVASTANITDPTATNMATIDNYTLLNGDRVLLKDQSAAAENGLYTYNSTTLKLTKITPAGNDNVNGTLVFISNGNTNKNDRWYCISYSAGSWILFDSNIELIAGSGISVSGNTVSIASSGVTNDMLAGSIAVAKTLLAAGSGLTLSTDTLSISTSGVTDAMLAGSISSSKLSNFAANGDGDTWAAIAAATDTKSLIDHYTDLYSAIKLIRGTAAYNTSNTQSISGAYTDIGTILGSGVTTATLKNKITRGTSLPASNMAVGDICFLHS